MQEQARERLSLEQIRTFLESSDDLGFRGRNRDEVYHWVNLTWRQQGYQALKRSGRGLVRRYLEKTTGLSRAQITRLITVHLSGEEVKARPYRRYCFAQRYSSEDVALLVAVDTAHDTLSGPATQNLEQSTRCGNCSRRSTFDVQWAGCFLGDRVQNGCTLGRRVTCRRVVKLLLDAQQRMTSLYGVVRGKPPQFFDGNAKALQACGSISVTQTFEFYQPVKMQGDALWIDITELIEEEHRRPE